MSPAAPSAVRTVRAAIVPTIPVLLVVDAVCTATAASLRSSGGFFLHLVRSSPPLRRPKPAATDLPASGSRSRPSRMFSARPPACDRRVSRGRQPTRRLRPRVPIRTSSIAVARKVACTAASSILAGPGGRRASRRRPPAPSPGRPGSGPRPAAGHTPTDGRPTQPAPPVRSRMDGSTDAREPRLGVRAHAGVVAEVQRERDAGHSVVAREDVDELVVAQLRTPVRPARRPVRRTRVRSGNRGHGTLPRAPGSAPPRRERHARRGRPLRPRPSHGPPPGCLRRRSSPPPRARPATPGLPATFARGPRRWARVARGRPAFRRASRVEPTG